MQNESRFIAQKHNKFLHNNSNLFTKCVAFVINKQTICNLNYYYCVFCPLINTYFICIGQYSNLYLLIYLNYLVLKSHFNTVSREQSIKLSFTEAPCHYFKKIGLHFIASVTISYKSQKGTCGRKSNLSTKM